MQVKALAAALAAAALVCAAAQTHAQSGWVGQEEVQSIAWTNSKSGPPWPTDNFIGANAFLRVPDIAAPFSDAYYAGKVGVTNFQGATIETGAMKFCVNIQPAWCALRPYASGIKNGVVTRFIDSTITLGNNQLYNYTVERDQAPTAFRAIWRGGAREQILLRYDASPTSEFPQVFTGAASIGPRWVSIFVGAPVALQSVNGSVFSRQWCYAGTQNRNQLTPNDLPRTSQCAGANNAMWTHNWAKYVYSPIVTR